LDPGDSDEVWSVGNDLVVNMDTGNVSSDDSDVFTGRQQVGNAGDTYEIVEGTKYTITVIDTNSQRQVYETTVTA
jgi:hypothetical protein